MSGSRSCPQSRLSKQAPIRALRRALSRLPALWHVGCITLFVGCPYVTPGWVPLNIEPTIIEPERTSDLILVMDAERNDLFVIAEDPNPEDIVFFDWFPPLGAEVERADGQTSGGAYYSQLVLIRDPSLDGQELRLVVSDGDEEVLLTWQIQLPGNK